MDDQSPEDEGSRASDSVSRREFVERGARYGMALGVGSWARQAQGSQRTRLFSLSNAAILAEWSVDAGRLRFVRLREPNGATLDVATDTFTLILSDGEPLRASELRVVGTPRVEPASPRLGASRVSERLPGKQFVVVLEDYAKRLRIDWRAELRDGSRYIRQELVVRPTSKDIGIREIVLVDLEAANATVNGTVRGSPLIIDRWFAAVEHPLA